MGVSTLSNVTLIYIVLDKIMAIAMYKNVVSNNMQLRATLLQQLN